MKLRRLLLLSCIGFIGAIGVSQAIDVNVPGARPDIAKEAYQEYRIQGNLAKEVDSYQEAAVRSWAQHQQNYNNQDLDDDIYRVQELVRAMNHSRTVYIITDNGADIKFTGSKESIVGWSTDLNKSLLQNTLNERLEKRRDSVRFVDGDVFTYPGLEKATWDVIGFDDHLVVGTINFTLPKTPNLSYHIGQSLNKDIIKDIIKDDTQRSISDTMGPLANFVLPSIKPASDVLSYTDPVHLGPYTFRVLKNSKLKEHEVIGPAEYDVYLSGRIKAVIGKQPLVEGVSVEKQNVLYSYLKTIVENHGVKGHKRLQYATVWNNSVPALYYEVDKVNGTLLGMALYDNQNLYTYYLYKPHDVHVSNYKLRDVIQYVETKDSKALNDKISAGIGISPIMLPFIQTIQARFDTIKDKKLQNDKN